MVAAKDEVVDWYAWAFFKENWPVSSPMRPDEAYIRLQKMYNSEPRDYHNWKHIKDMLYRLTIIRNQLPSQVSLKDQEFLMALFFHDAVYVPGSSTNEANSVTLFYEWAAGSVGYERVGPYIMATKTHKLDGIDPRLVDDRFYTSLLIDLDLHFLGLPWDEFVVMSQRVRNEYPSITNEVFDAGRRAFFQGWLTDEPIFQTDAFYLAYEAQTRENIERTLDGEVTYDDRHAGNALHGGHASDL